MRLLVKTALFASLAGGPACDSEARMSFDRDIQPSIETQCIQCHNPSRQDGALDLMTDPYSALLDNESHQSELPFVAEENHLESYLWHKVNGTQAIAGGAGTRMPLDGAFDATLADLIADWIDEGARP